MDNIEALLTALAVTRSPMKIRRQRRSPLPKGMYFLLKVASGDRDAVSEAKALTGRSETFLRAAAGFFIEQILLSQKSDSYRVFGLDAGATNNELRSHMALLMKWLHPDLSAERQADGDVDRTVFVNRVTSAWEDLKSDDRRNAYDQRLIVPSTQTSSTSFGSASSKKTRRRGRTLKNHRVEREGILGHVLRRLRGV